MNKLYELKEYVLNKKNFIIIALLVIIIIILGILNFNTKGDNKDLNITLKEEPNMETKEEIKDMCMVDIKGYIKEPGLYEVECSLRILDVINKAGGLLEDSDTSVLNLGKKVFDEMVLVIYSKEEVNNFSEVKEKELALDDKCKNNSVTLNDACIDKEDRVEVNVSISDKEDNSNTNKLVSINTATKEELMTLSGVGEAKALAIINYRNENGLFTSIEDIMKVSGIGEKMFEKIKAFITL